jgi:hypothetical protein
MLGVSFTREACRNRRGRGAAPSPTPPRDFGATEAEIVLGGLPSSKGRAAGRAADVV